MNNRNRRNWRDEQPNSNYLPQNQQGVWRGQQNVNAQQQQAQNYARQRHGVPWNNRRNPGNQWSNGQGGQNYNRQRNNGVRPRRYYYQQQISHDTTNTAISTESDIPGYVYDEQTKKYFKILPDSAGVPGFTKSDVMARRNRERLAVINANRPRFASGSFANRPVIQPIADILRHQQNGMHSVMRPEVRLFESRLLNMSNIPSSIHETEMGVNMGYARTVGCQYLDVSRDGKILLGCWALGGADRDSERSGSQIVCYNTEIDNKIVQKSYLAADSDPAYDRKPRNYLGLSFKPTENILDVAEPNLVDMVTAPVDSDVTCALYVTAATRMSNRGLHSYCDVYLRPIHDFSKEENSEYLESPIYNIHWNSQGAIWSCAWNSNKMRVGLGLENSAKVIDVLTDRHFFVPSGRKNVLSQEFGTNGDILYMGLKAEEAVSVDLRSNKVAGKLRRCRNVGWIKAVKDREHCIITDNFQGQLKMWDARRLDRELLQFPGHRNSHYRLPCFVDPDGKAVFAVGEDGTTRGWSLRTGDLLCAVGCPRPVETRTDFPRVVYSDSWGGKVGNGALVLAVGENIRVHELTL